MNCCHKPVRCANVTASYLSRLWYRFHQLLQGNSSALLPPPREACAALAFRSVKKEIEVNIVVKIGAFLKRKNIAHKLMEKEDLEKSPLSFPRSSDQDEGFDNIHSYSVYRTDLCI